MKGRPPKQQPGPVLDGFSAFSEHVLGNKLYPKQKQILDALDPVGSSVTVVAANESGKTAVLLPSAILGAMAQMCIRDRPYSDGIGGWLCFVAAHCGVLFVAGPGACGAERGGGGEDVGRQEWEGVDEEDATAGGKELKLILNGLVLG